MDIIIFGGQSNMQGQGDCLSDDKVIDNAYEYKFLTNKKVPLKNPVGENITYDLKEGFVLTGNSDFKKWVSITALASACYNHTNLVPSFCKEYTKITGKEVLAVHAAKGSTTIAQWLEGGENHEAFIKKIKASINFAGKENVDKIYFVWLQGESDAIYGTSKETYKNSLIKLNNILKKEADLDKFGIIRVGRFVNDERDDEIITAQDEICLENSDFIMLTTIATELNKQKEYMHKDIAGHYSSKGLEKLGSEAGKTLANFEKSK